MKKQKQTKVTLKITSDHLEALKFLKWVLKVKSYDDVLSVLMTKNAKSIKLKEVIKNE